MFLMSYHYQQENVIVMVNKYFYKHFYLEPCMTDTSRDSKILNMHISSMKFIAGYLNLGCHTGNVLSEDFAGLVEDCFPGLVPFLMEQRACRRSNLVPSMNSVDYDALSLHLSILTTTDWVALFHIAELEENRRGRAIRYVSSSQ